MIIIFMAETKVYEFNPPPQNYNKGMMKSLKELVSLIYYHAPSENKSLDQQALELLNSYNIKEHYDDEELKAIEEQYFKLIDEYIHQKFEYIEKSENGMLIYKLETQNEELEVHIYSLPSFAYLVKGSEWENTFKRISKSLILLKPIYEWLRRKRVEQIDTYLRYLYNLTKLI